jgi:formylglycine-generating enzyme required for sulfatase activity
MMQIPAGAFLMGSPEDELERLDAEGPQHEVNIATFFMGKYPVTQAQWRAVAALPQASRELEPDPSGFKGDQRRLNRCHGMTRWSLRSPLCPHRTNVSLTH